MPRSSTSPSTPLQKVFRSLFFGLFAFIGLALCIPVTASVLQTLRTHFWKATPCTIVESRRIEADPETSSSGGDPFVLRYRYRIGGRHHTSDRFTLGVKESLSTSKIERLLARHPAGSEAQCYVDPKNPTEAVFRRGSLWLMLLPLLPLIFVAIGAGGIAHTWRPQWFTRRVSAAASQRGFGNRAQLLFFGVFTLVGGVLFYFATVRPLLLCLAARSWPEVPCEIISSSVGSHRGSGKNSSTTYSIDIVYRYAIGGREYRSDRYEVMGVSSSGMAGKQAVVARYPAGSKAVCYVNPDDPTDALLHRGPSWFMLIGLLPLVFLLVGLGGLAGMIRSALKASGSVALPGGATLPTTPTLPTGPGVGPVVLKPSVSPLGKLIGAILLALIWNGVTGIFVGMAVKSWRSQQPEIFLSLIMIPFVLVGLALLGFVGMTFLNLFNPRIALAVNAQSLPPGGTLEARWSFRGAVSRIRRLRIFLECREEVTTGSGKNRRTDRKVLATLPLIETDDPLRIREGSAKLVIPKEHPPSDDEGAHRIVWELKVAGEIPRYPDVGEDFAFTVLPKAG